MKLQKAKKVAIKYDSYRVIYLFKDVPVGLFKDVPVGARLVPEKSKYRPRKSAVQWVQ